jgi:hypothetical protein
MCRRCWFAFSLARGDKDNIGAARRQTLAIFADCAGPNLKIARDAQQREW